MKIIQVIASLTDGGAEKFVIDLSNELSKNNEVIICTLFDVTKDMYLAESLNKNIKVISFNKKKGLDIKVLFRLFNTIKIEKPDVINTHLRGIFYSSLVILFSKVKVLHTVHNMAEKETGYIYRKLYKIYFSYFNVTPIAISEKVLKSIHREYSDSYNNLIENGVKQLSVSNSISEVTKEIDSYKTTKNTKVFVSIGRIGTQKNYALLVKTVNKLITEKEDIILLIIGRDYGELENLKAIANDKIHFLGTRKNVVDYIANADAFCISSLYEGLPIVLLESLSMGCIPICTPAGGIVDVIDSNIGFLSKGFEQEDYYKVMKKFLDTDTTTLNRMREACKVLFESKYSISYTATNYLNLYKKIIK